MKKLLILGALCAQQSFAAQDSAATSTIDEAYKELEALSRKSQVEAGQEIPMDVEAIDKEFQKAQSISAPSELVPNGGAKPLELTEPGEGLVPPEQFARVPLRPRMSDANWRRYAGKALSKIYRIRGSDTLWGTSELLFGNPYLWPKVWQLNASITNPHVIEKNTELNFEPGNPGSAPRLAFKTFRGISADPLNVTTTQTKRGLLELLDSTLRQQIASPHPPFQYFLMEKKPEVAATLPEPENVERMFYDEGSNFVLNAPDGEYTIVRLEPAENKLFSAYKARWVGNATVSNRRCTIDRSFIEITPGDVLISKKFYVSPLALYETRLEEDVRAKTQFVPLQEGAGTLAAQYSLVGIRFPSADSGPRTGGLLAVTNERKKKLGTLLIVDRNERMATAWLVESEREVSLEDRLE